MFLICSHCLEVFARRRMTLMVEVSSSLAPGPACVYCETFPCFGLLPLAAPREVWVRPCSLLGLSSQSLLFAGQTPLGLSDPSHRHCTDLAQAGKATGTWPQGRGWNQPSPALGKENPGQCRPWVTLLGMTEALFMQQQWASTPGTIFRYFFLCCVLFCHYMSSFPWSDQGLDKTGWCCM